MSTNGRLSSTASLLTSMQRIPSTVQSVSASHRPMGSHSVPFLYKTLSTASQMQMQSPLLVAPLLPLGSQCRPNNDSTHHKSRIGWPPSAHCVKLREERKKQFGFGQLFSSSMSCHACRRRKHSVRCETCSVRTMDPISA